MTRLITASGVVPLVTGVATAAVLCAVAVFAVVRAGCENPGFYQPRGGTIELVGGCLTAEDLRVTPEHVSPSGKQPTDIEGVGHTEPAVRP